MSCSNDPVHSSLTATLGGLGAILLWSATVALTRSLSEQVGPVTAGAATCGVSGAAGVLALLGCGAKRRRILRLPPAYVAGCGALFTGYMLLLYLAIGLAGNRQQALEVALLNYLWPVLTVLLSLVLLRRKAGWMLLPSTLLALAGVILVVTQGGRVSWQTFAGNLAGNPAVYALAVTAAVAWAVYSNLTRRLAGGQAEGAVDLFLPITAVVLFLVCRLLDEPGAWTRRAMIETLVLGATTYGGYSLWDNAMRRGNVLVVAAASYLMPALSTGVSCLYLGVVPGSRLWIGCAMLVVGSLLSWRSVTHASAGVSA